MNYKVIKKADKSRYAHSSDIRLVNFGTTVLFSKFELTASSGKQLKDNNSFSTSSQKIGLCTQVIQW